MKLILIMKQSQFCGSEEEYYDDPYQAGLGVPLEMVHGSGRVATIYISGVPWEIGGGGEIAKWLVIISTKVKYGKRDNE